MAAGKKSNAFTLLEREYPTSPWAARARTVTALKQKVRDKAKALRAQEGENTRLTKEVAHLRNDLEKLKKLLIETETRTK